MARLLRRATSIRARLVKAQLFVASVVLFACTAAFLASSALIFRKFVELNLESTAKILGRSLEAALAFNDRAEAAKILASLELEPSVIAASVVDAAGKRFAGYGSEGGDAIALDLKGAPEGSRLLGRHLVFGLRMGQEEENRGTLRIKADLMVFAAEYRGYVAVVGVVFLVGILLSLVLAQVTQRALSKPIVALADTAREISR